MMIFVFFKQKTAYEMRISDWSSDVCSSVLPGLARRQRARGERVEPVGDEDGPGLPVVPCHQRHDLAVEFGLRRLQRQRMAGHAERTRRQVVGQRPAADYQQHEGELAPGQETWAS